MSSNNGCPCKSGKRFDRCCGPIHNDHSLADTPEKLMRSRYSAFVMHNEDYLLQTWSKSHRPNTFELDDATIWVNLEITEADLPFPEQEVANVSFIASFILADVLHQMKEISSFTLENGLWFYIGGRPTINRSKLTMKTKCPCGSGKKYKSCCRRRKPLGSYL